MRLFDERKFQLSGVKHCDFMLAGFQLLRNEPRCKREASVSWINPMTEIVMHDTASKSIVHGMLSFEHKCASEWKLAKWQQLTSHQRFLTCQHEDHCVPDAQCPI